MKQLFVKSEGEWFPLNQDKICWITKSRLKKNYVSIHFDDFNFESKFSLNTIDTLLPEKEFLRVHNSYIIRLDRVTRIESGLAHVRLGTKMIPVGESYASELLKHYEFIR